MELKYKNELTRAMQYIAENPRTLFIGQSVVFPGNSIYKTIDNIPLEKRIELPVFEDTQMGMSIGLALAGYIPISIYPRFNFLLLALNQLVNHLDKIPVITNGKVWPKVIIRVSIGSEKPLFPGVQHSGDFTEAVRFLLKNVEIVKLDNPDRIFEEYKRALDRIDGKSTLLIEHGDYYNEK